MLGLIKKFLTNSGAGSTSSFREMLKPSPSIWLLQSDPKRNPQSYELAVKLTNPANITKVLDSHTLLPELRQKKYSLPDFVIGCGRETHQGLIELKKIEPKIKTISIIDSGQYQKEFDVIITPSYEPHSRIDNIIETFGLINFINPVLLKKELALFNYGKKHQRIKELALKPPFIAVMLGGIHTGGNITAADALKLADQLNIIAKEQGATLLISSSARTEAETVSKLEKHLEADYFLYDYKHGRTIENPYTLFLALADKVIVTGDSIRMMSEACSSGKATFIYDSENIGFQYKALSKELVENGYANYFSSSAFSDAQPTKFLDEATRVAEIIKKRFYG